MHVVSSAALTQVAYDYVLQNALFYNKPTKVKSHL